MPGSVPPAPLDLDGVQIPYHFRCPISLELMRDPVTVSTGQTYDRSSIESWVATGNTTCPVTRAPMEDFTLIPNHTLRRLIQEWCVANRSSGVERIPTPKQPADPALVRSLVAQSSSTAATVEFRLAALRRLRSLSRDSENNRRLISEFRSVLVSLAFGGKVEKDEDDAPTTSNDLNMEALAVASVLPLSEDESSTVASRPKRLTWLAELLKAESPIDVRVNAAAMIEAISTGTRTPELRVTIATSAGIMEGLVAMIGAGSVKAAAKSAIRAVFSLCLVKQNRSLAIGCAATERLVDRIGTGDLEKGDVERALATVELLCRSDGGCDAVVAMGGTAAEVMVKVMTGRSSDRAAEHAVGVTLAVCVASEAMQREAVVRGVVPQLLLMVQGGCTERAKRKAQVLLKLLWSSAWATKCDSTAANSDAFQVLHQPTFLRY